MKKLYRLTTLVILCLALSWQVHAQRYVLIEASDDPTAPADLFPAIMGDTLENGARTDSNTIYQLENGEVYITTGTLVNTAGWTLHIEAVDLDNIEIKPVITRIPNASGTYPNMLRPEGDITVRNLWMITGERGPGEQHQWGQFRIYGDGARVIVDHCIIEKDRGGFIQMRASGVKAYVTNSILRNGGNRKIFQGNGRGIDSRNFAMDTLIVRNTIIHNIQDRVFRSQGATEPHNYIEFDHNTVFNQNGRHGTFQFGRARTVKATNNLLINPNMMGTTPAYTDEQTQPDNTTHKVFTIDTLYEDTDLTFASNNIFWDQEVLDIYENNDTVSRVEVYSDLILQALGEGAGDTYFEEVLTLSSVPVSIVQYVRDIYANPAAEDMFDFIVEDAVVAGTALDFGNLFDFSTFSPCYDGSATSATAGTDGGPIGAVASCSITTDINVPSIASDLKLQVQPNPVQGFASFKYTLKQAGPVRLSIFDMMGRNIQTLTRESQTPGDYQVEWNPDRRLQKGIYIARLQTSQGEMSLKIVLQ